MAKPNRKLERDFQSKLIDELKVIFRESPTC